MVISIESAVLGEPGCVMSAKKEGLIIKLMILKMLETVDRGEKFGGLF